MFKSLKNKISNWSKKISEKVETKSEIEETLTEKEIKIPLKFELREHNFQPNLEKIKKIEGELENSKIKESKKGFFEKITSKVNKVKISEEEFIVYSEELEMLLLENNVALEIAEKVIKKLKEKIVGKELLKKEVEFEIKDSLREIIEEILIEPFDIKEKIKEKNKIEKNPFVILFCGINGTGKTTTIAKIASYLKENNISCVLAAADTFRAAAIEQLKKHGENLKIKTISSDYKTDPASVGFDAINHAKKNKIDCVLIDTAGRIHTNKNLLKEIEKISRICKPDLTLFIGESITGNDSIEQVRSFNFSIGIDGIILTKADIDEKGGTALSLGYVTKKPILFLGTGQEYNAIKVFNKKEFLKSIGLE